MAEATAEEAPGGSRKSKKTLLIVIIAVVVLLGGGAGAWFAFAGKGADAHKKAEQKPPRAPAQFVDLEPPFVVNFDAGSQARFLQISVQLMTRDPAMVQFLTANTPIIRNDLLLLFGNRKPEEVSTNEGKEALRAAALQAVRKIIAGEDRKPEALEAVYFTSFVMQ